MYWYFEPLSQAPRGQARIKADQRRVMRVTARDDVYLQASERWQCTPCSRVHCFLQAFVPVFRWVEVEICWMFNLRLPIPTAFPTGNHDLCDVLNPEMTLRLQRLVTDSARWATPADDIIGYAPSQSTRDSPRKVRREQRLQVAPAKLRSCQLVWFPVWLSNNRLHLLNCLADASARLNAVHAA